MTRSAGARSAAVADPSSFRVMRKRASLLIGDKRRYIAALAITATLSGFTEAGLLALVAQVALAVVKGEHNAHVHLGAGHVVASRGTLIGVAFGLVFARLVLQFPISHLPARIAADVQSRTRTRLFHAYTKASWDIQSRDREGQLQETITSQVMQATGAAMQLTTLMSAFITFVVLLASAFALNALAAAIVLAVAVSGFAMLRPARKVGVRRARMFSEAQVQFANSVAESVRLAEETQVYGTGAAQRRRVDVFIERARNLFYGTQLLTKLVPNLYQSLVYLLLVAGLAGLAAAGRGHAGSLGAIVLVLIRASGNGQVVQAAYQGLTQSMPFIERTQETERRYRESTPVYGELELERVETIAFAHVGFSYRDGQPVLDDLSFNVEGREAIGIVGPSGAGKSTLVQLLLRLREPGAGQYIVNGVPASEYVSADWQRMFAYVPQEPRLLHASVKDNIRYFRELDDESLERAARLARIHEDIMAWPQGYDTIIGPRADAVSGGQKQRVCLARALAAQPAVLVLDEPTSALDPQSEALIGASLASLQHELTLFIVAHRMSTLDICDRVMVIVDGKLVAFDTRALLEAENPYYRSASAIAAGTSGGGPA